MLLIPDMFAMTFRVSNTDFYRNEIVHMQEMKFCKKLGTSPL